MKSSDEIEKALYESSNSSISITKKDGNYFNVNEFKDIEKIKEIVIDDYHFSEDDSNDDHWVFIKNEKNLLTKNMRSAILGTRMLALH